MRPAVVFVVALAFGPAAAARPVPPVVVVLDVGREPAPLEVRAAVEAAVEAAQRVRPHPDAAVRAALRGEDSPAALRFAELRAAVRALAGMSPEERLAAVARLGRAAGADRVLAVDVAAGRVRARLVETGGGAAGGGRFEAAAQQVVARPADLAAYLDGAAAATQAVAPAVPARAPPAHPRQRRRWWYWAVGAVAAVALGFAIYQSDRPADQVTVRVVKP